MRFTECVTPGCKNRSVTKGRCKACYDRYRNPSDGRYGGAGRPKLTPEDVAEIRRLHSRFVSKQKIAERYKVSVGAVTGALTRDRASR